MAIGLISNVEEAKLDKCIIYMAAVCFIFIPRLMKMMQKLIDKTSSH